MAYRGWDLVSRLKGIIGVFLWLTGVIALLTKCRGTSEAVSAASAMMFAMMDLELESFWIGVLQGWTFEIEVEGFLRRSPGLGFSGCR